MKKSFLTPPEIARNFGVGQSKILGLIRAGELEAIDLSSRGCTRPRYAVSLESLQRFIDGRRVVTTTTPTRRLRRGAPAGIKEFF